MNYALDKYATLEWFRDRTGINPWAFWGWQCADCCKGCKGQCQKYWSEFNWQNGRLSRQDVRQALNDSQKLFTQVTSKPAGNAYLSETVDIKSWHRNSCELSFAELTYPVKRLGVQRVLSFDNQTVNYFEADRTTAAFGEADCARPMWFSVTFTPAEPISADCVYQLHVPQSERFGNVSKDTLIITDFVDTETVPGEVTIWGRPWQMGKRSKREAADCDPIDCTVEENFLTQLELVTVCHTECGTTAETACVTLLENYQPCAKCKCCGESADNRIGMATLQSKGKYGRIKIENAVWNSDTDSWDCCTCLCRPDQVKVNYLAGEIEPKSVSDIITPLAAGLLPSICDNRCGSDCLLLEKYMQDFTYESGGDQSLNVPFEFNDNPFGFTYGAGLAWKRLTNLPGYVTGKAILA